MTYEEVLAAVQTDALAYLGYAIPVLAACYMGWKTIRVMLRVVNDMDNLGRW